MTELVPHDDIKKMINHSKVVIFGKGEKNEPHCGFTARIQVIFNALESDYTMINILDDEALRLEMKTFSAWPTFPQVYINGEFIGGGDIVGELYESGELKTMILS